MDRFEEAKLRIKEATDLVALIEGYLPMRTRGRLLVALCPFHAEKSPSFTVWPDSQHYYCFGCGKSGDVFTFLMEREGLSFREAMETLAQRAQVSLEGVFTGGGVRRQGPDPHAVLGEVAAFLQQQLHAEVGHAALDYLAARGLGAAAEPWQLGFHPDGALRAEAQRRRWPAAVLDEAGLLRGGREAFAGRVMFPSPTSAGASAASAAGSCPAPPSAATAASRPSTSTRPSRPSSTSGRCSTACTRSSRRAAGASS